VIVGVSIALTPDYVLTPKEVAALLEDTMSNLATYVEPPTLKELSRLLRALNRGGEAVLPRVYTKALERCVGGLRSDYGSPPRRYRGYGLSW